MGVKLNFALCGTDIVHIEDRLYKNIKYRCPHCHEDVIFKKGNKREHHFSHRPGSNCVVSRETLLHFEAKHFLVNKMNKEEDIKLKIDLSYFKRKYKEFLRAINIVSYEISLLDLLKFYKKRFAEVEQWIGDSIADVVVRGEYDDPSPFVIEVYVTHANEEKKVQYFEEEDIPFLEVIPIRKNSEFMFEISDASISEYIDYISSKISTTAADISYNIFKDELIDIAREDLTDEILLQYKKQAIHEVEDAIKTLNYRYYINGDIYKKMNSVEAKSYMSKESSREELLEISYKNSSRSKDKYLMVNNRYFLSNEQNLLYSLIYEIQEHYQVEAIVGGWEHTKKEKVIGFNILVPNNKIVVEEMNKILNDMLSTIKRDWITN
ncbi:competence protein CoiA family protein [Bacillus cereus]|nr:competence protein CoiA family protein [Bacillus cereus]MDA2207814.1 competence protein CoiA family protein [Bacillus cereus]MDA2754354.1 competence protein CoiA family protein [Bacillus cereus]